MYLYIVCIHTSRFMKVMTKIEARRETETLFLARMKMTKTIRFYNNEGLRVQNGFCGGNVNF